MAQHLQKTQPVGKDVLAEYAQRKPSGATAKLTGRTGNLSGGCVQTGDWEDWRYLVLMG